MGRRADGCVHAGDVWHNTGHKAGQQHLCVWHVRCPWHTAGSAALFPAPEPPCTPPWRPRTLITCSCYSCRSQGKAKAAVARLLPILDRTPHIDSADPGGAAPLPEDVEGTVELRDVRFFYPSRPEVDVFRGFNLTVAAGRTVALVDESGSSKSTVCGSAGM